MVQKIPEAGCIRAVSGDFCVLFRILQSRGRKPAEEDIGLAVRIVVKDGRTAERCFLDACKASVPVLQTFVDRVQRCLCRLLNRFIRFNRIDGVVTAPADRVPCSAFVSIGSVADVPVVESARLEFLQCILTVELEIFVTEREVAL